MATVVRATPASNSALELLPVGVWDVHHHIFDPSQFSYSTDRHLTPPPATIEQFLSFKESLGIVNSVLTHGLSYGSDCSSLLAFLDQLGRTKTKGVGVIDPETTSDTTIDAMHAAGVRGIRVNLYIYKAMHDLDLQKLALRQHAKRTARVPGWSMTFTHTHPEFWGSLKDLVRNELAPAGIRLVTDHFALLKGESMLPETYKGKPLSQPGFKDILELLREGLLWVKLSAPYRVSEMAPAYEDLEPVVKALVGANPHRILWGSDWPHTPRMVVRTREEALKETPYLQVDDMAWIRSLRSWLSDWEWELMMVQNPKLLYDW